MTGPRDARRRYRRLMAWYPRPFRREYEEEMIGVLMTGAEGRPARAEIAEVAALIRSAVGLRLRPNRGRPPRTVQWGVRLIYAAAALELVALVMVLATLGDLRSAVTAAHPAFGAAQWHTVLRSKVVPLEIGAPLAALLLVGLGRANARGRSWARIGLAVLCGLNVLSLLSGLADGSATYAAPDLIAGAALCLVALAAVALLFNHRSSSHYRHSSGRPTGGLHAATMPDRPEPLS